MTTRPTTRIAVLLGILAGALPVFAQQPTPPAGTGTQATPPSTGAARGTDITLSIGEQRVIPAEGIRSYSEGVPGIVDVRVPSDGSRIVLVGQRAGSTTLLLIRSNGTQETLQISVFARRPEAVQAEIESLLEGYTGVQIRRVGARLYLEGGVANEAQQRRVGQIAALYPGQVESLVSIDPTIVERRINVRLDMYFVDFNYTSTYQVGLGWPTSIGGFPNVQPNFTYNLVRTGTPGMETPPGFITAQINVQQQPLPRLDIASTQGWARIFRQSVLITANGNEANYRNGGELYVPTQGANGVVTLTKIQFGTTLHVTPRFDPQSNRIDLRLSAEISDPIDRGTQTPNFNTSQLETLVNLQLGQSIMMSGFRSRQENQSSAGLPLLHQIPILGALFGTNGHRDEERESVIFIVPTVIEGVSRQSQDRIAEALHQYEEFSGDMDRAHLFEQHGPQYR